MERKQAFINWSGGKDATFSLYELLGRPEYCIRYLLTTVNKTYRRISMHGVREELLTEQARQIGIPLKILYLPEQAELTTYNDKMQAQLRIFSKENIQYAAFGDIFLEDLKKYREEQLKQVQMKGVFPLWRRDTRKLLDSFLAAGFKAIVTCVNARVLDKSFAGRVIDRRFIHDLPPDVDPCGENGEFHSFVFDGPIFSNPVHFTTGEIVEKSYGVSPNDRTQWDNRYYFCDLCS